jgi:pimeloyl-ACP methyl ester carboxylesterase
VVATVVLVHGAWHGAWCWDQVVERLDRRGVPSLALDLPGHGDSREPLGDLGTDAAALRGVLDGLDAAVVCGHSYGGAVISDGAAHPAARHLVYLAALLLDVGESCSASAASAPPSDEPGLLDGAIQAGPDGQVALDPSLAPAALYGDCAPADVERAVAHLGPQAYASLTAPAAHAAWREVPSTYVVCRDDRAIPASMQRQLATRAETVLEWPTSHSPFLSRPDLVADLLASRAVDADRSRGGAR